MQKWVKASARRLYREGFASYQLVGRVMAYQGI
jgi:hypothetical protein